MPVVVYHDFGWMNISPTGRYSQMFFLTPIQFTQLIIALPKDEIHRYYLWSIRASSYTTFVAAVAEKDRPGRFDVVRRCQFIILLSRVRSDAASMGEKAV